MDSHFHPYDLLLPAETFPRNNHKEEKLFQLLQKAYVDGRYESHYSITLREPER